ncbi:hypothetical protein CCR75_000338 [Bremia lactucae]|uniref:Uncharacterized protein n=1 Tax=Bremia lactucae TaxID=4779 RepID=A0A976IDP9_BRELC|nr:hypothetical protein CCR75_000338 [Bremia lactucae]
MIFIARKAHLLPTSPFSSSVGAYVDGVCLCVPVRDLLASELRFPLFVTLLHAPLSTFLSGVFALCFELWHSSIASSVSVLYFFVAGSPLQSQTLSIMLV